MHPAEIKVNTALHQCRELLTNAEYDEVNEFSEQYGEYGIAIETLAGILFEKKVVPNENQFNAIHDAFTFMGIDSSGHLELLRGVK